MQRMVMLRWHIVGFLLLTLSQMNYAQNLLNSPANSAAASRGPGLPTPSTMSNDAFKAKVQSQNAETQKSLDQEVKNDAAKLEGSQQNMPQPLQPLQPPDNTGLTPAPANTAPEQMPEGAGEHPDEEMPSSYTVQPSPNNQAAPQQNNTQSNTSGRPQGGWQIQY